MEKSSIIVIVFIGILVLGVILFNLESKVSGKVISSSGSGERVVITQDNFYKYLSGNEVIKNLPKDAVINLRLYSFDSTVRTEERSYIIKKGSVVLGHSESADAEIVLSPKYVVSLVSDFCGTMKLAKSAGDVGLTTTKNQASLMWKYRNFLSKYKSCF